MNKTARKKAEIRIKRMIRFIQDNNEDMGVCFHSDDYTKKDHTAKFYGWKENRVRFVVTLKKSFKI